MAANDGFSGFSEKTLKFWRGLAKNNDKAWFEAHRADYEENVLTPSRLLVEALGSRLRKIAPQVQAIPQVNKSLFRINRDIRFSRDKSPYKTHMGIWLWEGQGKRMECSGFYFHLEPGRLMLGCGLYAFSKEMLVQYREDVAGSGHGPALARIVEKLKKAGYGIGMEHYKRVPRGYKPDHPRADLLRYSGLAAMIEGDIPKELLTAKLPDWCLKHFQAMLPVHKWLLAFTKRAARG